jgi:hypothetical protein
MFGGGSLSGTDTTRARVGTVGITLQPRAGRIALRFDALLHCGRNDYDGVIGSREVAWNGVTFSASGRSSFGLGSGHVAYRWRVDGRVDGAVATGLLRVTAVRRGKACRGDPPRSFEAHVAGGSGQSALPQPGAAYVGLSDHVLGHGLFSPVVLRAASDGRSILARYTVAAPCNHGEPREFLTNFTPATTVRADGSFRRAEHFTYRYSNTLTRFRALFTGHFTSAGASGTLSVDAHDYDGARRHHLYALCSTGTRHWSATLAGTAASP